MSEEMIPDVTVPVQPSDVPETPEVNAPVETVEPVEAPEVVEAVETVEAEESVNFADKTLAELVDLFQKLTQDADKMKKSKDAEAIKSAFYKKLLKEKTDAQIPEDADSSRNPFDAIEEGFKSLYAEYKKERAEFNRQQEQAREENLATKLAIIEDLKNLVERQEDVSATFPAFREIQNRWRAAGPIPAKNYRDVNDTYQFYVEKFYDMVKINRDLRDLDFKKNLDAKVEFCEMAEKLAENENVVEAFRELQKLHEQWKEYGPVAKEHRDAIWERFRAATGVINKRYQAYFETQKEKQGENLAAKEQLCARVEEIAEKEVASSNEWNALARQIEEIQKEWRTIGFATKKENHKIYERFRAACDKFFEKKRLFYSGYKDTLSENLAKKEALIAEAEALKASTEWKKATDQFINLQKQWKEIGAVPRKKSEQLWKRFRAACDEFFDARSKSAKPENDFYANLKAKKQLIEDIRAFALPEDSQAARDAAKEFNDKWQEIGFVPFKEKDALNQAFREAMQAKFPEYRSQGRGGRTAGPKQPRSEKDLLIQKYNALQQDIDTYENNIGFFSMSKNAEALIKQMQKNIDKAKEELKALETKIREMESNPEA